MEGKRLYRSRKDRMICGVCGGIAKYFNIDPTLVRLAFVLISMGAGSGVLAYIVAALLYRMIRRKIKGYFYLVHHRGLSRSMRKTWYYVCCWMSRCRSSKAVRLP